MSAIITDWEQGKGDEGGFVFEMKNKSIQFAPGESDGFLGISC
jgi:hypothetical protein